MLHKASHILPFPCTTFTKTPAEKEAHSLQYTRYTPSVLKR